MCVCVRRTLAKMNSFSEGVRTLSHYEWLIMMERVERDKIERKKGVKVWPTVVSLRHNHEHCVFGNGTDCAAVGATNASDYLDIETQSELCSVD